VDLKDQRVRQLADIVEAMLRNALLAQGALLLVFLDRPTDAVLTDASNLAMSAGLWRQRRLLVEGA